MIDAVTLAILRGRLEQIADEMDATLFRSAFNPTIAEAHDASHGLYDPQTGDTLVQGKSGLPIFVGVMAFAVKAVIDKANATGGPREGDTWIFNDPYVGGTHLSDFRLVRPLFHKGQLVCYLASVGHWHDVGGNVPGNYNPAATESFQEGMRIPPVKLIDQGRFLDDVVEILSANSRTPVSLNGDLHAQLNALDLGVARMHQLLEEYTVEPILEAFSELTSRAQLMIEDHIRNLPDGTFSAEDYIDNDGVVDLPLTLALDLTFQGDRLVFDFTRSSGACAGPVNISRATTIAACYVALKHFFPDVPANGGVLRPVSFIIPEDSFLSVKAPKPVGGYTETIMRLIDVVFQALAQVAPERSNGCAYGTINALSLAGHRSDGSRWVLFSFFGGGHGGHPVGDGLSHGNAPISTATIPPLEILEAAYPVKFNTWSLRPDSAGAGRHRGGFGAIYEIELLDRNAECFLFGERGRFPPKGVVEGGDARLNRFTYNSDGVTQQPPMTSKALGIKLKRGETVRLETPGGGGYGVAFERSAEAVAADHRRGLISADEARTAYGVVLDDDGAIDLAQTQSVRAGAAQ